mmetsp:Transcript_21290/g.47014  ORF Transcript_21290/g.47014 Transcript_21290/m.47014 type:complete len:772 (-) Transcript_21290:99-2414(-)
MGCQLCPEVPGSPESDVAGKGYILSSNEDTAVVQEDSDDIETLEEPKPFMRPRRGALIPERIELAGYYKRPYWNKHDKWVQQLHEWLKGCQVFQHLSEGDITQLVSAMSTHLFYEEQCILEQGEVADSLLVVLEGAVERRQLVQDRVADIASQDLGPGSIIDEIGVLWSIPRSFSLYALTETCILAKLTRANYMTIIIRDRVVRWWGRQYFLRASTMLETMGDEQVAKLVDCLEVRDYMQGTNIVTQGDEGNDFFIMDSGEARVWVKTGTDDEQEYRRYHRGDLFGELALLGNACRAANVTAETYVQALVLSCTQFERLLGPMANLHQQQYLTDPRKLVADFYAQSDSRGPRGTLVTNKLGEPDPSLGVTSWLAVYRPTSRDAIAKMLSGTAVGKGLNVKGKSAKQGVLSGFVPFSQISDNKHKELVEESPPGSRLLIYYKSAPARAEALKSLLALLESDSGSQLDIVRREVVKTDDYEPAVFGLDLPEPLVREAYLMKPDLSPVMGWETGRRSEPAYMNMNLHAVRDASEPKVVLYQTDESDAMNPRGLLIAYAEKYVKPVVSDFDTFLVASRGMDYEPITEEQVEIVLWLLDQTEIVLNDPSDRPWTSRWLEVIKREGEKGFHPTFPKYGFGDPTSYRLIGDIVSETSPCGAIRHAAECFNFYFPQELDDEFLVIWEGFPDKPWSYKSEEKVRMFLMDRIAEGFCFPLNPVWPVRDQGWYSILEAIRKLHSEGPVNAWYPPGTNILERIDELHRRFPAGFVMATGKPQN